MRPPLLPPLQKAAQPQAKEPAAPAPELRPAPKPWRVVRWIMTNPGHFAETDTTELEEIRAICPHLDATSRHVRDFADMMRDLRGEELPRMDGPHPRRPPPRPAFPGHRHEEGPGRGHHRPVPLEMGQVAGPVTRANLLELMGFGRENLGLIRRRILNSP